MNKVMAEKAIHLHEETELKNETLFPRTCGCDDGYECEGLREAPTYLKAVEKAKILIEALEHRTEHDWEFDEIAREALKKYAELI